MSPSKFEWLQLVTQLVPPMALERKCSQKPLASLQVCLQLKMYDNVYGRLAE